MAQEGIAAYEAIHSSYGVSVLSGSFEVGSTTLFFGAEAKRDAWLAMALAACAGLLLLTMYLIIHRTNPELDLYELCRRYFGKVIGFAASFAFAAYFTYEASRNLRDLGELTVLTLLNRTPLAFIMLVAIIVIASTVMYGPRVVFLVSGGLMPIILLSYATIYTLLLSTGLIKGRCCCRYWNMASNRC